MNFTEKKCLIAYYSRKGNNYAGGSIINLPTGNMEVVAKIIHENTGGKLFHIDTLRAYPADYNETTEVAQRENRENARPELTGKVEKMDSYDVIFLGYPNWWSTMPMVVFIFLESYDFSGKIIIPFCTHEGSGLGSSEKDIAKLCPKAILFSVLAIQGSYVNASRQDVENWSNQIKIKQIIDIKVD